MKIVRLGSLLFALVLGASALWFDPAALAGNPNTQNSNSSTTMTENSNAPKTTHKRGRRHRRRAPAPAATAESTTESTETPTAPTEQTDLSGTYTGTFDCSDAGVSGETTLTITGNQFTLSDGKTGRIVATTTRGYTGVAMQFGELTMPTGTQAGSAPTIVSMRAKKSGDRLTLTSVPGATHVCSFKPTGAASSSGRRHRRRATAPAAAAEPTPPGESGTGTMAPAEPATAPPASRRRGRRGRRGTQNPNTNSNTNANDNTGEASPTPTPPPALPRN
ncbi:MAG TPA: hypothetical protein VIF64_00020 [Pyrinomonadaceae bacterium]